MSISLKSTLAAVAFAALAPTVSHAADCREFAATGSGITVSIATLMAKQGAVNVAEARGYSVQGEAKLVSCTAAGTFGNECTATTHACKTPH